MTQPETVTSVYCLCGAQWHGKWANSPMIAHHAKRAESGLLGCRLVSHDEFNEEGHACKCPKCKWPSRRQTGSELSALRAECERLKMQIDGLVAPEELHQWKAVADALRVEMHAQADRANEAEMECERLRAENERLKLDGPIANAAIGAAAKYQHEAQALRNALEKYGRHKATCASTRRVEEFRPAVDEMSGELTTRVVYVPANLPCDCGLVAVLAGGEAATQETPE